MTIKRLNAAVLAALTIIALNASARGAPNAPDGSVRQLLRQPYAGQPGTDVVVIEVDYPPGRSTPPHEHGGFVYAYVLEGAVESQLDDARPVTYQPGQMWSETPHQRHMISRNASATAPAKLLVFFIVAHGAKLTTMLTPAHP